MYRTQRLNASNKETSGFHTARNKPLSAAQIALKRQQDELKKKLEVLEQDKKKMQEKVSLSLQRKQVE